MQEKKHVHLDELKATEYLWIKSVNSQVGTCGTRCPVGADGPLVDTAPVP